jgi:hypothetical protein
MPITPQRDAGWDARPLATPLRSTN